MVIAENLQARLRIGVVCGLEAQPVDAHLGEEDFHEADQSAKREAKVGNDAFDLVELGQMRGVHALVAEDTVDGEVASGARVGGELVKHICAGSCGVCPENEAERLVFFPGIAVADRSVFTFLVHQSNIVPVALVVELLFCFVCRG